MTITTTLKAIRALGPCEGGYKKLLAHLGKTKADDEPLPLLTILDSNDVQDALWCFCALGAEYERWARLTLCDLVEPAMAYTVDPRPKETLEVVRRHARGEATDAELGAARAAAGDARDAAGDAAGAALSAADYARGARAAAWAAAWDALEAAGDARAAARAEQERILRAALDQAEAA